MQKCIASWKSSNKNVIDEMNDLIIESTYYLDRPLNEIPIFEKETLVDNTYK